MKKLLIAAILLVSIAGFAQDKKTDLKDLKSEHGKINPEERTEKRIAKMTKDLILTLNNKKRLERFEDQAAAREKQRAEIKRKMRKLEKNGCEK
jgi:uncharacterized protein HemX